MFTHRWLEVTARANVLGLLFLVMMVVLIAACSSDKEPDLATQPQSSVTIAVTSPAFTEGSPIPVEYTCQGDNISPVLKWANVPDDTKSMALIMDDPDAPGRTFVHWVLYNIPATANGLSEASTRETAQSMGAAEGRSGSGRSGYGGPCPPSGSPHRYFFRVYALDTTIELDEGATKTQLLEAMQGKIIAQGELVGTYSRSR